MKYRNGELSDFVACIKAVGGELDFEARGKRCVRVKCGEFRYLHQSPRACRWI